MISIDKFISEQVLIDRDIHIRPSIHELFPPVLSYVKQRRIGAKIDFRLPIYTNNWTYTSNEFQHRY